MGNSLSQQMEESTIPDEVLLEILSRVSLEDLPSVPFVCRRFSKLVRDPNFIRLRLRPTLHVFNLFESLETASVPLNSKHWSPSTRHELLPPLRTRRVSFVSLGRSIYIISREGAFRHDTWTKVTAPIAHTLFPCDECSSTAINGKVYVCSTVEPGTCTIEEYDPEVKKWHVVTSYTCKTYSTSIGVGAGGVFYLFDPVNPGLMEGYDVSLGKWVEGMPARLTCGTGSVVGSCGTQTGHVYIITCEAMKLRFLRWEGIGKEWIELEAPAGIIEEWIAEKPWYLLHSVNVSCVAVRDERVVAIVKFSHDRDGVRPPTIPAGWVVLMYSVADGSWSRGWDLPINFYWDPALAFTEY